MEKPVELPPQDVASLVSETFPFSSLRNVYRSFNERREALGLSNPGTVENVAREVQREVFLNNYMFAGLRADITKASSASPLFQTAHNFTIGAQGMPPYSFAALYGSPKVFMQGNIDNDGQLSARANYRWSSAFITKTNIQVGPGGPGQAMVQVENDYTGADFSCSLKAMNPSILEDALTGIYIGSYLQSVTPKLALGVETIWQRAPGGQGPETATSYAARYKGSDWIGSAQVLAQGGVNASYWKRLTDRVECGVDISLQFLGLGAAAHPLMGGMKNEGVATIGAKYDFRHTGSTFRGQIDTHGKVSCLLEKRVAPPLQVTFAGEVDHVKNTAKVGLAISLEAAGEEYMEQQEKASQLDLPPPPF